MTVHDAAGFPDSTVVVQFDVQATEQFVAVQFDFIIPEGFSYVANSAFAFPQDIEVQGNVLPGTQILRIISFSLTGVSWNNVMVYFSLNTPSQTGIYPMNINNGIIGTIGGENILDEIINDTVTISGIDLPGDANCDGAVNVLDVTHTVQYALGIPVTPFCFENADVNGDGIINVADVTGIIAIILNQKL
jgi:hypothetical protein